MVAAPFYIPPEDFEDCICIAHSSEWCPIKASSSGSSFVSLQVSMCSGQAVVGDGVPCLFFLSYDLNWSIHFWIAKNSVSSPKSILYEKKQRSLEVQELAQDHTSHWAKLRPKPRSSDLLASVDCVILVQLRGRSLRRYQKILGTIDGPFLYASGGKGRC